MARGRRGSSYWGDYERSPTIKTTGGIKAQSQRGAFGKSWWAKRWIEVLEGFQIGTRLARGRSYARQGQVTGISIEKGLVKAQVQGSRPTPYEVTIKVNPLSKKDWEKMGEALSSRASFAVKLLAGEMPNQIGDVFIEAGLTLFPNKRDDLETDCSCPDWSNPCKHVAAVYYLLGEAFDGDPFLIFKMRGLGREALIKLIGALPDEEYQQPPQEPEPLPLESHQFWGVAYDDASPGQLEAEVPSINAAFVRRLGAFPFWRGQRHFLETLEDIYARASPTGSRVVLGETTQNP